MKTVCIDFDGTIAPWGPLFQEEHGPMPGAVDAIRAMADAGCRIVILTSRLSPTWLATDPASGGVNAQVEYLLRTLRRWGVPFEDITYEKIPADYYLDDHAVRVRDAHDWADARAEVLGAAGSRP